MASDATIKRHQDEIARNLEHWENKPLLRMVYADFYNIIKSNFSPSLPGRILEIGSGIGKSREFINDIICSDLFPNRWIDIVCSAYHIPFNNNALSHIVLFDVFHHLEYPMAFLNEARRTLVNGGRLIIFEPYISVVGWIVYGILHPEPIGWRKVINLSKTLPNKIGYYAAQGDATRLFFKSKLPDLENNWEILNLERLSCFSYIFSGGYSKPALYPAFFYPVLKRLDAVLSRFPEIFAARCLVVLKKTG
jgi:SAM-dependent methyltransferase